MSKVLKAGEGWRVGWNPAAPKYQGLIGTGDWAIELTAAELEDFCRLAGQLAETMAAMTAELMDEEGICLEVESEGLWLAAEGMPQAFSLRFILSEERNVEGYWAAAVVPELLRALQGLKIW